MNDFANGGEAGQGDGLDRPFGETFVPGLVWLAGLLSTLYLAGWASFALLLALGFSSYLTSSTEWEKAATIALHAVPLCTFVVIGFAGLTLWPCGRLRLWGLSAIVLQTVLAICALVHPMGILIFYDWLR